MVLSAMFHLRGALWIALRMNPIRIIVYAGTLEIPCAAEPLCGTDVRDEVVSGSRYRRRLHSDSDPERTVGCGSRSEDLTLVILNLPIAAIASEDATGL